MQHTKEHSHADDVLNLLDAASILDVDGNLVTTWFIGAMNDKDDDVAFAFSYEKGEGVRSRKHRFTEKALKESVVKCNQLQIKDTTGELVEMSLYTLNPLYMQDCIN